MILRLPEVLARTGLSKPTVYRQMSDGCFPRSVKLGGVPSAGVKRKSTNG